MGKRRSWFDFVKKIFTSASKAKPEKKDKRNRWLFGKLKRKTSPVLPSSSLLKTKALREAEEEQSKHAVAVAVATAAAAEAAVAAAQAAAEVVRLTGTPSSYRQSRDFAAIKIQTAFRGYLARRALRALKALVKIQALVRGRAVRRQTSIALKNLQSLIRIQEQARANRIRMVSVSSNTNDSLSKLREPDEKYKGSGWDSSPLSKEEIHTIIANRQKAALKRERALEYASARQGRLSARRHSLATENGLDPVDLNHRWSWLENWVETQPLTRNVHDLVPVPSPEHNAEAHQHHVIDQAANLDCVHASDEQEFRPMMRRSFNRSRRGYIRDDESFTSSPAFPSYMAFTESAKARSRSMSTPKQRMGGTDFSCGTCVLSDEKLLSPFPSISSDVGIAKLSRTPSNRHRSPRLRNSPIPSRSPSKRSQPFAG